MATEVEQATVEKKGLNEKNGRAVGPAMSKKISQNCWKNTFQVFSIWIHFSFAWFDELTFSYFAGAKADINVLTSVGS